MLEEVRGQAVTSAMLFQMSRRPSPSASTAWARKTVGRNWVLAHRIGPGTDHAFARDVAALQDAQRRHQLLARPSRAASFEAQRGERVDGGDVAVVRAVVALHAPDRDHDLGRRAVVRARGREFQAQRLQLFLAARHADGRDGGVEVVPDGPHELGLAAIELDPRSGRKAHAVEARCAKVASSMPAARAWTRNCATQFAKSCWMRASSGEAVVPATGGAEGVEAAARAVRAPPSARHSPRAAPPAEAGRLERGETGRSRGS